MKLVFTEMQRQNVTYDEVEYGSGVLRTTVKAWRSKNKPGLDSIEAVMGFLGWDFVAVPRDRVLPPEVVAELRPLAERFGMTMPKTVAALLNILADQRGTVTPLPLAACPKPLVAAPVNCRVAV